METKTNPVPTLRVDSAPYLPKEGTARVFAVRLPETVLAKARKAAKARGITVSYLLRLAISQGLLEQVKVPAKKN